MKTDLSPDLPALRCDGWRERRALHWLWETAEMSQGHWRPLRKAELSLELLQPQREICAPVRVSQCGSKLTHFSPANLSRMRLSARAGPADPAAKRRGLRLSSSLHLHGNVLLKPQTSSFYSVMDSYFGTISFHKTEKVICFLLFFPHNDAETEPVHCLLLKRTKCIVI